MRANNTKSKLLIDGYVHEHENSLNTSKTNTIIPLEIIIIVILYYPTFNVYGIGRNQDGLFGLGHTKSIEKYKYLSRISHLMDNIESIYKHGSTLIIVDMFNNIFICGQNICSQCGYDSSIKQITSFQKIDIFNKPDVLNDDPLIVNVGIALESSIIANNSTQQIYGCGFNEFGQLSLPEINKKYFPFIPLKTQINNLYENHMKIKQIACCNLCTLFLMNNGQIYICGCKWSSNPFEVEPELIMKPQLLCSNMPKMRMIATGHSHLLCIDNDNNLWCSGDSNTLGLGDDNGHYMVDEPILNKNFMDKNVKYVACGNLHSAVLLNDGSCYIFGKNFAGQIGTGYISNHHVETKPFLFQSHSKLFENVKIMDCSLGYNFSILLSDNYNVYAFGDNRNNQFSVTTENELICNPILISYDNIGVINKNEKVVKVIANAFETILITQLIQ